MQTKKQSLVESITNVAIGYGISVSAQIFIFPMFGIHVSIEDNLMIGACFTVVSIARSYVIRRFFNKQIFNKRAVK